MSDKYQYSYSLNESPFFKLSSEKRLTKILQISSEKLKYLSSADNADNFYLQREIRNSNGKLRAIEEPIIQLKQVQKRISNLLHRIEKPNYLFSPTKGKSYIDNALEHRNSRIVRKLDIKSYFQSTKSTKVYYFFHNIMQCSPDVAYILTAITTFQDRLPTGAPTSPIISFYAHIDMWEQIDKLVTEANCILTVYMDDLTISGENIPTDLIWEVKKRIHQIGLQYHKEKNYNDKPSEITGVIVSKGKGTIPNRKHLKIHNLRQQLLTAEDEEIKSKLSQQLQGCIAEVKQIQVVNCHNHQKK